MTEAKERLHNSPITFRKAAPQDFLLIAHIEEEAHPLPEEEDQRFDTALIKNLLEEYEHRGENYSFIAYTDDVPIGHMLMTAHSNRGKNTYFIASWSVIAKYRSFQTANAMIKHALAIGGGCSSYRAWAREKTVMQCILKPEMTEWLAKLGYELHVDQDSRRDSGGEPHVSVRFTPLH